MTTRAKRSRSNVQIVYETRKKPEMGGELIITVIEKRSRFKALGAVGVAERTTSGEVGGGGGGGGNLLSEKILQRERRWGGSERRA